MTREPTKLRALVRSFVCRDEQEREWLLEMHERFDATTRLAGGLFAVTLLVAVPWLGPIALFLAAGGATFAVADRINAGTQRPERFVYAWLICQALFALAIGIGGGVDRGDLAILLVPLIGAAGGFPERVVVLCAVHTGLLMIAVGLGVSADLLLDDPSRLLVPLGLVMTTAVLTTAVRAASIEHRSAALIDPLTGMLNRAALHARSAELEQQSALSGRPVAVLSIDIDHFKAVNDDFGHPVGDAVLADVAYRIRACLRAYDLAYRMGGEEFAVLLPGASYDEATAVGEAVAESIRAGEIAGTRVTVSIGVAASPAGTPFSFDDVFAAADVALYRAKTDGRDRVMTASAA